MTLRCTLTTPSGEIVDLSSSLSIHGMSTITAHPELDLGIMGHGGVQLVMYDTDGELRSLFETATVQPPDTLGPPPQWVVVIDRENDDGGSERLFGGILRVPESISYDNKSKQVSVEAYSYSKVLESISCDSIMRPKRTRTASIAIGNNYIVFPSASDKTDLQVGDIVSLTDALGNTNEFTIRDQLAVGSTAIGVTVVADSAHTGSTFELVTRFPRDANPVAIATAIAAAAGITLDDSSFVFPSTSAVNPVPIQTPVTLKGLSTARVPISLVPTGSTLRASFPTELDSVRRSLSSPSGEWTDSGVYSNNFQRDWVPYLLTEPVTILDRARMTPGTNGTIQADTNEQPSFFYGYDAVFCDVQAYTGGTVGEIHDIRQNSSGSMTLRYYKAGSLVYTLSTLAYGYQYSAWIEWDPYNDVPWISWQSTLDATNLPVSRNVGWYGGGAIHYTDTTKSGQLRFCRGLGTNGYMLFYEGITKENLSAPGVIYPNSGNLNFINPATKAVDLSVPFALGWPLLCTARYSAGYLSFQYQHGTSVSVAIYRVDAGKIALGDASGVTLCGGYLVSTVLGTYRTFQSVMTLSDARKVVVGYAGGAWYVLSPTYDGVIRYAAFEDQSCASAAAKLAAVVNSIVNITPLNSMQFKNRLTLATGEIVADLDAPLTDIEHPISDSYRASVSVIVKIDDGTEVTVVMGDKSKSASRLEIKSKLLTTVGEAVAVASSTLAFVANIKSQRDVSLIDSGERLELFQRVTLAGVAYAIYGIDRNIGDGTVDLTLLEVTP
jgi:hypothetical protein